MQILLGGFVLDGMVNFADVLLRVYVFTYNKHISA